MIQPPTNSTTNAVFPDEFNSEFAGYHRGAFAFRRGQEHWSEARQAWEDLLKRPEEYVEQFQELLEKAVRDRLPRGPCGIFMSGGLDSTSVAASDT